MKWWAMVLLLWFIFCVGDDSSRIARGETDVILHQHWPLYVFIAVSTIWIVILATAQWARK